MSSDASDSQVDLSGQVALVTGGGGGLGRALVSGRADALSGRLIRAQDNEEELRFGL